MNPHVLVVSNNPMNKCTSNGRTLKNLLVCFAPEELAQFYIKGQPDFSCCKNFYQVSDQTMMDSLVKPWKRREYHGVKECYSTTSSLEGTLVLTEKRKMKKTCRSLYCRCVLWSLYSWWTSDFEAFINDFQPEAVLVYAGDAPFMLDIARKIAKRRSIPLLMYSCENYVLKDVLYAWAKKNSIWHRMLRHRLKISYARLMKSVDYCFYNTEYLEQQYQNLYPLSGKSCAVYTAFNMDQRMDVGAALDIEPFTLLYCGNMGVGRAFSMFSMAKVLEKVNPRARIKIFGVFPNAKSEKLVTDCPNVVFGGMIPYKQVIEETKKCSMLVHCENPERVKNLMCAFSTKIADSISSGVPFLVYASREYPFVQYLEQWNAAHIATDEKELEEILIRCMEDHNYRLSVVSNAVSLSEEKHSLKKNGERVCRIIEQCCEKSRINILNSIRLH